MLRIVDGTRIFFVQFAALVPKDKTRIEKDLFIPFIFDGLLIGDFFKKNVFFYMVSILYVSLWCYC
jgi:hypothetical protein